MNIDNFDFQTINLGHGSGGVMTRDLLDKVIFSTFDNPLLNQKHEKLKVGISKENYLSGQFGGVLSKYFQGSFSKFASFYTDNEDISLEELEEIEESEEIESLNDDIEEDSDEIENEEMFDDEDMSDDDAEEDLEMGDEEAPAEEIEDRVEDLESALSDLEAEFEKIMAGEDDAEDDGEEMDMDMGDIDLDIEEDYTMGYAKYVGFRASTCTPFYFYDLDFEIQRFLSFVLLFFGSDLYVKNINQIVVRI